MSKNPAEAFTVQDLETGNWVAVAFHSNNYAGMEDRHFRLLLDELETALKFRRSLERGTSLRVEFVKREMSKTRPVYVVDDNSVEAELLLPVEGHRPAAGTIGLRDDVEPVLVRAEDDGVLNAGSALDVSDGGDATVDLLELANEFSVFLSEAALHLGGAGCRDANCTVSNCDLCDSLGYGPVPSEDLVTKGENVQRERDDERRSNDGD